MRDYFTYTMTNDNLIDEIIFNLTYNEAEKLAEKNNTGFCEMCYFTKWCKNHKKELEGEV